MTLSANGLTRRFGRHTVLQAIDLRLEPGSITALLGPNGAGKTTLLRLLAGLARPTAGTLTWQGQPLAPQQQAWRRQTGVVLHPSLLYEQLTALENLRFTAGLYQLTLSPDALQSALERVGLGKVPANRPVREFSRGMKQRLTLARALLPQPRVLLLDEPYTGLDQQGCAMLNGLLVAEQQRGCLVLFTTHELDFARQVAQRFLILHRGKIVDDFSPDQISLERLQQRLEALTTPLRQVASAASAPLQERA